MAETQRSKSEKLPADKRRRLDELGFVWDVNSAQWEVGFKNLEKYHDQEGHCLVPLALTLDGFNLGRWVNNVRQQRRQSKLLDERIRRLDELGFSWNTQLNKIVA